MPLVSLETTKAYLGISDNQLREDGVRLLVEPGPTSATCQVLTNSLEIVIVGGANPGTYTFSLIAAATDTITELVAALNASVADITAEAWTAGDALSIDLIVKAATDCLGEANAQTLSIVDNYSLNLIIDRISDYTERYCGIEFESASISERYDGDGSGLLILNNKPVNTVTRVSTGAVTVLSIANTATTATSADVRVDSTTMTLTVQTGAATATNTLTLASYATLALLAAAINALGSGWEATEVAGYADYSPTDLVSTESLFCLVSVASLDIFPDGITDYLLYSDRGWILYGPGFPRGFRNILVSYSFGFAVIPGALQEAVLRLISIAYYRSTVDPTLQSERLGDHSWARSLGEGTTIEFTLEIQKELALWRKYDIAVS